MNTFIIVSFFSQQPTLTPIYFAITRQRDFRDKKNFSGLLIFRQYGTDFLFYFSIPAPSFSNNTTACPNLASGTEVIANGIVIEDFKSSSNISICILSLHYLLYCLFSQELQNYDPDTVAPHR